MNTIRKISVGSNYPDGALHYQVGKIQKLNGQLYEIKSIETFIEDEAICYTIVLSCPDGSNIEWKQIKKMPVVVEKAIDFE